MPPLALVAAEPAADVPLVAPVDAAGRALLAAPAPAAEALGEVALVTLLPGPVAPNVTEPTASCTLSGGAGTVMLALLLVEPVAPVELVVEAPVLAAGAALLVPDVPVVLDVPLVLLELPLEAPLLALVQAGLPPVAPVAVLGVELTGEAAAELAGLAEAELTAPELAELTGAALARADAPALPAVLGGPLLPGAALPAQAARISEAAATAGMRAFNMTWTPPLRPHWGGPQ